MNSTEKLFKRKMLDNDVESIKEAARMSGMDYQTLLTRVKNPGMFRVFELISLMDVLKLTDDELLTIIKGEDK